MGTLAAGLGGCSWGDARFDWPWSRQSTPVAKPEWSSNEAWPERPADQLTTPAPIDPNNPTAVRPNPSKVTTVPPISTRPAAAQEEPLKIGETREITTSVLPIKGKFITVQEILHESKDRLSAIESDGRFDSRVRDIINRAVARRINNELIFSEADDRLSKGQKEHVNTQVAELLRGLIADAGGSKARLEKLLAEDGLTIQELQEEHRRGITVRLYQRIKFLPAISITRQMLLGYYNKHQDDFRVEKKVAMQLIAVQLTDGFLPKDVGNDPTPQELAKARAAARERIGKADKLLKSGEDYTAVAKEFSSIKPKTGGKLPLWPEGSLRQKKVEETAFSLKLGQRSKVVETPLVKDKAGDIVNYGGFYIVKAYEIQEGKTTSFEDAQEKIENILRTKQLDAMSMKFSERLSKTARIPQTEEFIETTVNEAIKRYWKPPTRS